MTKMTTSATRTASLIAFSALALSAVGSAAFAQPATFSFRSVEFMPQEQQVSAAKAFVARDITPGAPLATAISTVRKAGAHCAATRAATDTVVCTHTSFQRPSGDDINDVVWKVQITPAADGAVGAASVSREVVGL